MSDNVPVRPSVPDAAEIKVWLEYQYGEQITELAECRAGLASIDGKYSQLPDDEAAGTAGQNLAITAAKLKAIEERRMEENRAYRDGQATINGWFKDHFVSPVEALQKTVQAKLNAYGLEKRRAEQRAAEEARRKAEEEAQRAAAEAAQAARKAQDDAIGKMEQAARAAEELAKADAKADAVVARVRGTQGSISSGTVTWRWEIEDFSAVPDYYKTIDEAKIREAAKERGKGNRPTAKIPGIRWVENFTMRTR